MATVARLPRRARSDPPRDDRAMWLGRQAAQLVAQLPDDRDEALAILEWAKRLVLFLPFRPA